MGGVQSQYNCVNVYGNVASYTNYGDNVILYLYDAGGYIPHYSWKINQRFADKTRPENVALPIALYMGRPAEI